MPIRRLTKIAILGALGTLLMFIQIPYPWAPFLKYDPGEIPVLLATFALGPVPALIVLLIKNLLHLILKFNPGTMIGIVMNFLAAGSFALTAGIIYRYRHTMKGALLGLIAGVLIMTVFMIPVNIIIYPIFHKLILTGIPVPSDEKIFMMVMTAIVPFNLIQGILNSSLVFLIYKRISDVLKK